MKPLYKYLFAIFCLVLLSGCAEELIDKTVTGTIKGTVVKKGSNEPLPNVKIYTAPTTETIFTGTDGTFLLENVPNGDYTVKAELEGYVLKVEPANLKNQDQTVNIVFEMEDDKSLNSPPSVPQLLSPTDNTTDQPLSLMLSWRSADPDKQDSLTYDLIIKNDRNETVQRIADLKENSYQLNNLSFGTKYFWQVVANDGVNEPVFSEVFSFRTVKTPPNRFHYVQKTDGNYVIRSADENNQNFLFTTAAFNSWRPRKNNNAGLVAFMRTAAGNTHIFTAKPDGSEVFQVTTIPIAGFDQKELDFSWSQNGKELLYPNFDRLYRINKDGSGLQLVYKTTDGSLITECDWSADGSRIALKTNDFNGYNVKIYVIDMLGNIQNSILSGVKGAAGGLNFSVDGTKLLYSYDISGFESENYRQMDTHVFIYNLSTGSATDISATTQKPAGTLDLEPRFSPNEAEIIFTNTSNDGISARNIYRMGLSADSRVLMFSNAEMPDWE